MTMALANLMFFAAETTTAGTSFPVTAIFTMITEIITGFIGVITSLFSGVVAIFWDGTNLTFVGGMALCGLGISLFYFGFRFIRSLIKMRG